MTRIIFNANRFKKLLTEVTEVATKAISDSVFEDVKRRSPVRSGLFKKSWRKSGSKFRYNLTNPQSYGGRLEEGRSKQAPSGVMRPAIENLKQPIRRYR